MEEPWREVDEPSGSFGMRPGLTFTRPAASSAPVLDKFAQLETLQALTAALSRAHTGVEVTQVILDKGIAAFGASRGAVLTWPDEGAVLTCLGVVGFPADFVLGWHGISIDAEVPIVDAIRMGAPVIVETHEERERLYPALGPCLREHGWGPLAALPLVDGKLRAGLALAFPPGVVLSSSDRRFVNDLSRVFAQALGRARAYDAEHQRCRQLERELVQAREQARIDKLEGVSRFACAVGDELTKLMTNVLDATDHVLTRLELNVEGRVRVRQIVAAAEHVGSLGDQLLAFGGKVQLQPRRLSVNELVEGALMFMQRLLPAQVQLHTHLFSHAGYVEVDGVQLEQVLLELVANARDALPKGGTITVETHHVSVSAQEAEERGLTAGEFAVIAVKDGGVGMDEATQAHLFEPLFSTKGDDPSRGLGLATAHGIVQQSGGHLRVESRLGVGTTFSVFLRAMSAPPEVVRKGAAGRSPLPRSASVLLVGNTCAPSLLRTLEALGHNVLSASTAEACLSLLHSHADNLDLLITEIDLGGHSGVELAHKVVRLFPDVQTLYLSGNTDELLHDGPHASTPVHVLESPCAPDELRAQVNEALRRSRTSDPR